MASTDYEVVSAKTTPAPSGGYEVVSAQPSGEDYEVVSANEPPALQPPRILSTDGLPRVDDGMKAVNDAAAGAAMRAGRPVPTMPAESTLPTGGGVGIVADDTPIRPNIPTEQQMAQARDYDRKVAVEGDQQLRDIAASNAKDVNPVERVLTTAGYAAGNTLDMAQRALQPGGGGFTDPPTSNEKINAALQQAQTEQHPIEQRLAGLGGAALDPVFHGAGGALGVVGHEGSMAVQSAAPVLRGTRVAGYIAPAISGAAANAALGGARAATDPNSTVGSIVEEAHNEAPMGAAYGVAFHGLGEAVNALYGRLHRAYAPPDGSTITPEEFRATHAEARQYVDNVAPEFLQGVRDRFAGRNDAPAQAMVQMIDERLGRKPAASTTPQAPPTGEPKQLTTGQQEPPNATSTGQAERQQQHLGVQQGTDLLADGREVRTQKGESTGGSRGPGDGTQATQVQPGTDRGQPPGGGNRVATSGESGGYEVVPAGQAQAAPIPGGYQEAHGNAESQASTLTTIAESSNPIDATSSKGVTNSATASAEFFPNLIKSKAFAEKGLRGLDVPTQRIVMDRMLSIIHNPQVFEAVVKAVPIDVVDKLIRAKSASDVLLHDPSVLINDSVVNAKGTVSIRSDMADSAIRAAANVIAKSPNKTASYPTLGLKKAGPAVGTLDLKHDVAPSSNVVTEAGVAPTIPASPIVSEFNKQSTGNTAPPQPQAPTTPHERIAAGIADLIKEEVAKATGKPVEATGAVPDTTTPKVEATAAGAGVPVDAAPGAVPAASPPDASAQGATDAPLPKWTREQMLQQGKNPARMLNDIDAARPTTAKLLENDPVTKFLERTDPAMAERAKRGDLSATEIADAAKAMKDSTVPSLPLAKSVPDQQPQAKQPHEMTPEEYLKNVTQKKWPQHTSLDTSKNYQGRDISAAIAAGKDIPRAVAKEVPNLVVDKQPWTLTKSEWESAVRNRRTVTGGLDAMREKLGQEAFGDKNFVSQPTADGGAAFTHKSAVEYALQNDKPVSPEVLREYPDLAQKYAPVAGSPAREGQASQADKARSVIRMGARSPYAKEIGSVAAAKKILGDEPAPTLTDRHRELMRLQNADIGNKTHKLRDLAKSLSIDTTNRTGGTLIDAIVAKENAGAKPDPFAGERFRLVNRESGSGDQTPPTAKVGDRVIVGGDPAKAGVVDELKKNGMTGKDAVVVKLDNGKRAQQTLSDITPEPKPGNNPRNTGGIPRDILQPIGDRIDAALKAGKVTAEHIADAATWLHENAPMATKYFADAAKVLLKRFGQAIKTHLVNIWKAVKEIAAKARGIEYNKQENANAISKGGTGVNLRDQPSAARAGRPIPKGSDSAIQRGGQGIPKSSAGSQHPDASAGRNEQRPATRGGGEGIPKESQQLNSSQETFDGQDYSHQHATTEAGRGRNVEGNTRRADEEHERAAPTAFAVQKPEERAAIPITIDSLKNRLEGHGASVERTQNGYRITRPNGSTQEIEFVGKGEIDAHQSNPENDLTIADSIVSGHGGNNLRLADGSTIKVPETIMELLNHPRSREIYSRFAPAGWIEGDGRIAIYEKRANMNILEEELHHDAVERALTIAEKQRIVSGNRTVESTYHDWYKDNAHNAGPSSPTDPAWMRIHKAIRDGEVWKRPLPTQTDKRSIRFNVQLPGHDSGESTPKEAKPDGEIKASTKEAADGVVRAFDSVRRILNPASRTKQANQAANIIREHAAQAAASGERAIEAMRDYRKALNKQSKEQNLTFIDKMEKGEPQATPTETTAAKLLREGLDSRRQQIQNLGTGKLEKWIENYFPHIWAEPNKAIDIVKRLLGKRPLEGPKSFLKKRTIPTTAEGIAAGLEPVSYNPVDMALLKYREMDKYLMAHRILNEFKEKGLAKFVRSTDMAPEGYAPIDDRVAQVYGPPTIAVNEYTDQLAYEGLQKLAKSLDIGHERLMKLPGGRLGDSSDATGEVRTRFATGYQTLAHEIGHQLDTKYGMQDRLHKNPDPDIRRKVKAELRALADMRNASLDQPEGHKTAYVRKAEEKMANVLDAYIHIPDQMEKVAPTVKAQFEKLMDENPELQQIRDIHRSLSRKGMGGEVAHGGLLKMGAYHAPEPVATVINNYLSPGLRGNAAFDAYMRAGNVMNQAQLGLSAFHGGMVSLDATVSKAALGVEQVLRGHPIAGAASLIKAAIPGYVPIETLMRGNKVLNEYLKPGTQGGDFAKIVDGLVAGGGRVRMDKFYKNSSVESFFNAIKARSPLAAAWHAPWAALEAQAKPLMESFVPRVKLGVFADMARLELSRLPEGADRDQVREAMARVWDSVDNREGQLVYDNLFWNKAAKDVAMASTRAVGWNLGTIRELGGGLADTLRAPINAAQGKPLPHPRRALFVGALVGTVALYGAYLQYMMTGQGPKELKDYFYPRTGRTGPDGNQERVQLPSYMKDLISYAKHPYETVKHKLHPLLASTADMLENKDFYGDEIRNPNDTYVKQLKQASEYVAKAFIPFSARGLMEERKRGQSTTAQAGAFVGVTPAPRSAVNSEAQNTIAGLLPKPSAKTPEAKAISESRYQITTAAKRGEDTTRLQERAIAGGVSQKQIDESIKAAGKDPWTEKFKRLSAEDAGKVMAQASPAEKEAWTPAYRIKTMREDAKDADPDTARALNYLANYLGRIERGRKELSPEEYNQAIKDVMKAAEEIKHEPAAAR